MKITVIQDDRIPRTGNLIFYILKKIHLLVDRIINVQWEIIQFVEISYIVRICFYLKLNRTDKLELDYLIIVDLKVLRLLNQKK